MTEPRPLSAASTTCMLVYGIAGAGKTRMIGTGPKTLILHPPTDHTESIEKPATVHEIVIPDHDELNATYKWGQQGGFKKYDWVWLDGISLMEDHGLDDVFAAAVARKSSRAEFGPDQGEYGINRTRLGTWVRNMVGLSKAGEFNFGVTANVMEVYDPVQEKDLWVPLFGSPKSTLHAKLCGYMNVVAYLAVVERDGKPTRRVLMTGARGFTGKDQYGAIDKMVDPTMPKVISAIKKARRPTKAARTKRPRRRT